MWVDINKESYHEWAKNGCPGRRRRPYQGGFPGKKEGNFKSSGWPTAPSWLAWEEDQDFKSSSYWKSSLSPCHRESCPPGIVWSNWILMITDKIFKQIHLSSTLPSPLLESRSTMSLQMGGPSHLVTIHLFRGWQLTMSLVFIFSLGDISSIWKITINNVFSFHIHLFFSSYWDGLGQNHHGVRRGIEGFQRRLPTKNSKHQMIINMIQRGTSWAIQNRMFISKYISVVYRPHFASWQQQSWEEKWEKRNHLDDFKFWLVFAKE